MDILTLDFETFYSTEYSLRKMTPVEYILDPRFQCTGLAVKRGAGKSFWIEGDKVQEFFDSQPENVMAVSHNALFDICICAWRYGWVPKVMVDTLGVSRALLQAFIKSMSLDSVAAYLGLGKKTGALANVKNMRLEQIREHPDLYASFIDYGLNDVDLCYGIFEKLVMSGKFPPMEIAVMDGVLRCAVVPQFRVNRDVLHASLATIKQKKEETLAAAMLIGAEGKSSLMSNEKFAELLKGAGVVPPTKISGTTGKETWAFAKSDQEFIDLLEHPDHIVQTLVSARMGHKSTIEETRHERFINISNLLWPATKRYPEGYHGFMPMPLRYAGAHTHRLSGDWSLNVQNMGRGSTLRSSLEAPDGYEVVAGDESQVEARVACTLCGQEDMRQQFERDEDVYSIFATGLFGRPITKAQKIERWIGKTCLSGDTMVLTDRGPAPIANLTTEHKLWDGLEWVTHDGLLHQGVKEVAWSHGLGMTTDHEILTELGWQEWREVRQKPSLFQSALGLAANSPNPQVTLKVMDHWQFLPVYDIANAGPRKRFAVMSDSGPIIVHNCILGLGFGLGKDKFHASVPILAWGQMGIKLPYTMDEAEKAVSFYRNTNQKIAGSWKLLNTQGIHALSTGDEWQWGPVLFKKEEIVLPNGMSLYYHNLRQVPGGRFGTEWIFEYGGKIKRIYGGKLLENIVQALARIIVMEAMVRVRMKLAKLGIPLALQVHDELVFVVKKEYVAVTRMVLEQELRRRPDWMPNLPLNCEIGSGPNYGDAK